MMGLMDISVILGAYLLGSVPFGLMFARLLSDVDVRSVGSGNIGATNVLRAAGKKAAVLTLLADAAKGVVPVLVAARLSPGTFLPAAAGIGAVLGHNFPVYLSFKGGKGVATSFGVAMAISPLIGTICLVIWLVSALVWRFSSLAALVAFAAYPLITFAARSGERPQTFLSLILFAMIYARHRENIRRLLAGTEPKIGQRR